MLLSATLSKPNSNVEEKLGKAYEKIKIRAENSSEGLAYYAEMFTKTQVFHQHFTEKQVLDFLRENAGVTFKNCVKRTDESEITLLTNKKGKVTELVKPLKNIPQAKNLEPLSSFQKKKQYLLEEGKPVPFLVLLGVMNSEGKVISSKYDKFKQINRFLEFINDTVKTLTENNSYTEENPIRIVDFGCGKSYLTFAVHYFLTEIKKLPCKIEGLDLKEDVILYCNQMTEKLKLKNLIFHTGNISDYSGKENPDIVITLHACDAATDFALQYAVEHETKAILSVPCCQHQINQQLKNNKIQNSNFEPLLKWGLFQEKFSSLLTDALRGEWLESMGYKVQMLEFIDMEHTPKNILIRAIKNSEKTTGNKPEIIDTLKIKPEIWK